MFRGLFHTRGISPAVEKILLYVLWKNVNWVGITLSSFTKIRKPAKGWKVILRISTGKFGA